MNYYNEIEPYCAQWLKNLMCEGLIPKGVVDDRSIVDVQPNDLRGFTQCHFFAGLGGWSRALELAAWPSFKPVWTGSCPCQPLSSAGQRKGHADGRHLWPAFYRLIAECSPAVVFGEQVASKDGREWFSGVRADLEALGYALGAADLCAASVGAPHIRQRLWFVANARSEQHEGGSTTHEWPTAEKLSVADASWEGHEPLSRGMEEANAKSGPLRNRQLVRGCANMAHTAGDGWKQWGEDIRGREEGSGPQQVAGFSNGCDTLADASGKRRQQVAPGPLGNEGEDGVEIARRSRPCR